MTRRRQLTWFAIALGLGAGRAWAQEAPEQLRQPMTPLEKVTAEVPFDGGSTLKAYPYIYYTPETDVAFGAGGTLTWRDSRRGPDQRPNSLLAGITYTTRNQLTISLDPEYRTPDDKWLIDGYLGYKDYPDKFWGIGPDAPASAEEDFAPLIWDFQASAQSALGDSPFLLGPSYVLMSYEPQDLDPDGQLASGDVPGAEGSLSSGLGVIGAFDTRDQLFAPGHGYYLETELRFFFPALGSDYTFEQLIIDLRHYRTLKPGLVLAVQAYSHTIGGDAPFNMQAMLGGSSLLRGYWTGRYRDRKAAVLQAEARFDLVGRLGGAVFAGGGLVGDEFRDWQSSEIKPSVGAGLRFVFDREANLKLRLDMGFGEAGQSGVYITVKEAF